MEQLLDNEYVSIQLDHRSRTVCVDWRQQVPDIVYRDVFTIMLDRAEQGDILNYLSDITHQGFVNTDLKAWMAQTMIPRAIAAGIRKVAVVMRDPDVFQKDYYQMAKRITDLAGGCQMAYFSDRKTATAWLETDIFQGT